MTRMIGPLLTSLRHRRRDVTAAAGEAVTLQHPLLQPLPGQVLPSPPKHSSAVLIPHQHWSRLADAVYATLDAYSGSDAVNLVALNTPLRKSACCCCC